MAYLTTTRAALRADLLTRWASSAFWTDTDANRGLNEALYWWNLLTGVWRTRANLTTTINVTRHLLPGALVAGARVSVAEFPVVLTALTALNHLHPNWRGETTISGGAVPDRVTAWVPTGLTALHLWPADAVGGNVLTVDGIADTPVLDTDAEFIDLSETEHGAILDYALHYAAFKEGGARFAATQVHRQRFLRAAADQNSRLLGSRRFRDWIGKDQLPVRQPGRQTLVGEGAGTR